MPEAGPDFPYRGRGVNHHTNHKGEAREISYGPESSRL